VRILSLGIALPDQQVDNYGWTNALSFFDYDAIVVDPMVAVSEMVEGIIRDGLSHTTYNEEVVQNGPTTGYLVGLSDLLKRRADETERLLARGGLVVCLAYPDVLHPQVAGFTGCHRYYWLPAPTGADYGARNLQPAGGTEVVATDYQHPFADFFERHRNTVQYRTVFAEGGFGEAAKVIARSPGGAAIALDLAIGGGRVVFLPALPHRLSSVDRTGLASSIVSGIRNLLLVSSEGPAPAWVSHFDLPGLHEAQQRVDVAESKLEALENELDEARHEYRSLDRYRRILWQEGKYGLDLPVRDALTLLGMTSFSKPDEPGTFSFDGDYVLVEAEGAADAIGLAPHYRLRQRIEQHIADRKEAPRALLVVNGFRDTAPAVRERQYEETLALAAETMRYAVLVDSEGVYEGPAPVARAVEPASAAPTEDEDEADDD
jgi:hypothetical protein